MNAVEILTDELLIKEGDTAKVFQVKLLDSTGAPVDLEGSSIKVVGANQYSAITLKSCDIVGDGVIQFKMTQEDVLSEGIYDIEVVVIYQDGNRETFPENDYMKLLVIGNLETRGLGEGSNEVGYELLLTKVTRMEFELREYVDAKVAESISNIDPSKITVDLSGLAQKEHTHVLNDVTDFEQYTSDEITALYRAMFE